MAIDKDKLLRQEGIRSWLDNYRSADDNERNLADRYTPWRIFRPDPSSVSLADRSFFRVLNVSYTLFGQKHRFDLFTTGDMLAFPGQQLGETTELNPASLYSIDIGRLLFAQHRGHQGSVDALTALHNTALQGGKTAFIYAHGITKTGQWQVVTERGPALVDEIVSDVSSPLQQDGPPYQLAYLAACNEDGIALDMSRVWIPVIANLAVNSVFGGGACVYFPEGQAI